MVKEFIAPGKVISGLGAISRIGDHVSEYGKKAFIVCDQIAERLGKVKFITDSLAEQKIKYVIYDDFNGEPTKVTAIEAFSVYKKEKCDFLIGIGGGSSLDLMKAVAAMDAKKGDISDCVGKEITAVKAKMIAIPTTAGTGSEATQFAMIIDEDAWEKMLLKGQQLIPNLVIIDPELSETLPPKLTAATGLDALAHAIEAYTSKEAQPLTDTLALSAIKRIFNYLPLAYRDGSNDVARQQMAVAALEAGIAFNNTGEALVHGMSRPIGALFHVPESMSGAMVLKVCLEYARDSAMSRFADMAKVIGAAPENASEETAANDFLIEIKKICNICHIPTLEEYGIPRNEYFDRIDRIANSAMYSGTLSNMRRDMDEETIKELCRKLFDA